MVEVIRDLKPRFMRFPGGTLVTGNGPGGEYDWKGTLGPLINRKGKSNLWGPGRKRWRLLSVLPCRVPRIFPVM